MLPARLPPERVVATYTWIAPFHDLLARLVEARARALGLAWAAVEDGEDVLEVAVGTGLSFRHLLRMNPNGWTEGIDLTPAMLRRARGRAARIGSRRYRLRPGSAYDLPYPTASFDLLLNSYMFDLLPVEDFPVVLQEFYRVLRPGGRLVMINMTRGTRWYQQLWEGLYRIHPALLGGCRGVLVAPYLDRAGFTGVRRRFVSQWGFPSEVLYAQKP
ncbi:MAG: ubiE/COQ5 methyltransferase [Rhodothermaceae bacterium]|nr:MAG: ubiE/COQ5 methyltransferase [Rhodothermaceae bacterium]